MFMVTVVFSTMPQLLIGKSREEIKALAPLMACVSKPMRMKDFPFQLADTLFQYSLLKQLSKRRLSASSTAPQKTLQLARFLISTVHFPALSNTPFVIVVVVLLCLVLFSTRTEARGKERKNERQKEKKNSLHVFCYPKQKTAREWTSGGESNTEPGNRRWDVKYNDMPSTQPHLRLLSRIIIQ